MSIAFDAYATLLAACAVLLAGRWVVRRYRVLARYSIPEPVVGGLLAALGTTALHVAGVTVSFEIRMQPPLLLVFFCTIGLTSNLATLRRGGAQLVRFVIVVIGFLVVQNVVGVAVAKALGYHPVLGLMGGSITLAGGFGTGAAWAAEFSERYGLQQALSLSVACATFGLIIGGVVGGPIARLLIRKVPDATPSSGAAAISEEQVFEAPEHSRPITPAIVVDTLLLMAAALSLGKLLERLTAGGPLALPDFVWVLFVGVLVGNAVRVSKLGQVEERAVSVIGNTCLDLFLALTMMALQLWTLAAAAKPLFVLLLVQTVIAIVYIRFVTFPAMGRNYDAAVLGSGQAGFGLGATPTAIANIQAITERYGPSRLAFLLVPIVGAFFLDLANAVVVKAFLLAPGAR